MHNLHELSSRLSFIGLGLELLRVESCVPCPS